MNVWRRYVESLRYIGVQQVYEKLLTKGNLKIEL